MAKPVDRGTTRTATIGAHPRRILWLMSIVTVLVAFSGLAVAGSAPTDTLVLVNGEPITAYDLDKMIMAEHRSRGMSGENSGIVDRLLKKRINDILIVQDAMAAGMDEEPQILTFADERREKYGINAFVKENLELPDDPPAEDVRAFFERGYWQIQVRRISVRTREEAIELRTMVVAGADMDSLARELSLDSKKPRGGLYNLLYWIDLEYRIQDPVRDLEVGEVSEIFPYNDAFSFCRVEQRLGLDESAFAKEEKAITRVVRNRYHQRLWEEFVDELEETMKVQESVAAIMGILADSASATTPEFRNDDPTPAIWIEGGPVATAGRFREAVSNEVMQNATAPFTTNLNASRKKVISRLVLAHAAQRAGYFDRPEIEKKVVADVEQALIELYLTDTVAAQVQLKRSELNEFYEVNKENFRGPEQVRLDFLILQDEAQSREAAQRLAEGADFAFILKEYRPGQEISVGESKFIATDQLSKVYRDQLLDMEVGESSQPIKLSMGWVIFRLAGRKPGEIAPIEIMEIDIRRAVYQQKFNSLLDEHLALLKGQSDIVEHPDRIEAYIISGGEEG